MKASEVVRLIFLVCGFVQLAQAFSWISWEYPPQLCPNLTWPGALVFFGLTALFALTLLGIREFLFRVTKRMGGQGGSIRFRAAGISLVASLLIIGILPLCAVAIGNSFGALTDSYANPMLLGAPIQPPQFTLLSLIWAAVLFLVPGSFWFVAAGRSGLGRPKPSENDGRLSLQVVGIILWRIAALFLVLDDIAHIRAIIDGVKEGLSIVGYPGFVIFQTAVRLLPLGLGLLLLAVERRCAPLLVGTSESDPRRLWSLVSAGVGAILFFPATLDLTVILAGVILGTIGFPVYGFIQVDPRSLIELAVRLGLWGSLAFLIPFWGRRVLLAKAGGIVEFPQ